MSALSIRKKNEKDMTEGSIIPLIITFAFPLLLGNLFQQLYNMVDTWVVGNFVGKNAFSAVGTLGSTINSIIGFFLGFSSGAGVVISQYYGSGDKEKVSEAVHTFVAIMLFLCVVVSLLGLCLMPFMLKILGSPEEVMKEQRIYLTIYFLGVSGVLIYNMGASIMRAIGDSKHPFLFLLVSSFSNIVLDLVFVIVFKWGTAGVALATIISQALSAICVWVELCRTNTPARVHLKKLKVDPKYLKKIFAIGLPTALQMAITAFSNVFVQSYINYFGADVMGGWTAFSKLDAIIFLPMQSLSIAAMTFVGQNLGKGQVQRARKGTNSSLLLGFLVTGTFTLLIWIFAPQAVGFFIDDREAEVIRWGTFIIRLIVPFHITSVLNQIYSGSLKGAGMAKFQMAAMLFSFVVFRQLYLFTVSNFISNTPTLIFLGYPIGWVMCSLVISVFYHYVFVKKTPISIALN